jgi:transcriptional regulator with XRE-family HTH domain
VLAVGERPGRLRLTAGPDLTTVSFAMAAKQSIAQNPSDNPLKPKARAGDFDRLIGRRIRERRILIGLTQQDLANLIGVTYQQADKYEKGIDRISVSRLVQIADALRWTVAELLEDIEKPPVVTPRMRLRMAAATLFAQLPDRKAEAIVGMMRALVDEPEESR